MELRPTHTLYMFQQPIIQLMLSNSKHNEATYHLHLNLIY